MNKRTIATFALGFVLALAAGWLVYPKVLYRHAAQPIQFNHKVHADKAGMSCSDCHALDANGRFAGIPKLETCAPCHGEAQGTSAEEKRFVSDYVAKNREVEWLAYARQPENVWFPHAVHVKLAKIPCERCHGPHGKSERLATWEGNRLSTYSRNVEGYELAKLRPEPWEKGMKMDDCSHCHHALGVTESCLTCHK